MKNVIVEQPDSKVTIDFLQKSIQVTVEITEAGGVFVEVIDAETERFLCRKFVVEEE
jgi:hypothetical protein